MILIVGMGTILIGAALIFWQQISKRQSNAAKTNPELIEMPPKQLRTRMAVGVLVIALGALICVLAFRPEPAIYAWCLFGMVTIAMIVLVLITLDMTWSLKNIGKEIKSNREAERKLAKAYIEAKRKEKSKQGNGKP